MTISARIIADSISETGARITTFELEYPRFIHAELMTHRVFSRNAASSRAIPVNRAIELIQEDTAMPVHWGKNQPGMSAKEECDAPILYEIRGHSYECDKITWWSKARDAAIEYASKFNEAGYHKQIVNRLLEPFTHIKVVLTSTEYDNWFWLRDHGDAQPEIHDLAAKMNAVFKASTPTVLKAGGWHVPYYFAGQWVPTKESLDANVANGWIAGAEHLVDSNGNTYADALAISSSCCAQVSYRRLDDSLEKARNIFSRLVESMPPHFSPFEHQATPMGKAPSFDIEGVTHLDRSGNFWSGNFKGWVQHRQLIMGKLDIAPMTSKPTNI